MSAEEEWFYNLYKKYGDEFNWMITSSDSFVKELELELGSECSLNSVSVIAKCESNDDVLFIIDGIYRIYHLTYSGKCDALRYLEFTNLSSAMKYIEKEYIENYLWKRKKIILSTPLCQFCLKECFIVIKCQSLWQYNDNTFLGKLREYRETVQKRTDRCMDSYYRELETSLKLGVWING